MQQKTKQQSTDSLGKHYQQSTKFGIQVLLGHLPLFALTAWFFETQMSIALGLPFFYIIPVFLLYKIKPSSEINQILLAISYMSFSGILIHLGKGMIEMHFHVFVFWPLCL